MAKTTAEALAEVIDSEEKWIDICNEYGIENRISVEGYGGGSLQYPIAQWWAARESARMHRNVYHTSEVLTWVNSKSPWAFIHVSQEDKDMVAFTVDPEAAKRDKQLKTSLGKALVKLFPFYRDEFIQQLVAEHKAEVNMTVEYLTDPIDIANAYKSGVHSCMAYEQGGNRWGELKGHHPTEAYGNVKGLQLAIIRGGDGKVKARTLVRPDQKKYIRGYGDAKLLSYLKREGYRPGDLGGLTLNTVDLGDNKYVMPYLDQNGAAGTTNRCTVAMIGGKVRVLTTDEYSRWINQGMTGHASGVTQSGYVTLVNVQADEFSTTDFITGEELTGASKRTVYKDGRKGITEVPAILLREQGYIAAMWTNYDTVYAKTEDTFISANGDQYVEDPIVRKAAKYAELSSTFYPGERWTYLGKKGTVTTEDGSLIREEDAVIVLNPPEAMSLYSIVSYWHKSEVVPKEYTKVHSRSKTEIVYAAPGVQWHRTSTGRKVVEGFHEIVQLWDKSWELRGNNKVQIARTLDGAHWIMGDLPAELRDDNPALVERALANIDALSDAEGRVGADSIRTWIEQVSGYMGVACVVEHNGITYPITNYCWPRYGGLSRTLGEAEIGRLYLETLGINETLRAASLKWYERRCRIDAERKRWHEANWLGVSDKIRQDQHAREVTAFEELPVTHTVEGLVFSGVINADALQAGSINVDAIANTIRVNNVNMQPFYNGRAIA